MAQYSEYGGYHFVLIFHYIKKNWLENKEIRTLCLRMKLYLDWHLSVSSHHSNSGTGEHVLEIFKWRILSQSDITHIQGNITHDHSHDHSHDQSLSRSNSKEHLHVYTSPTSSRPGRDQFAVPFHTGENSLLIWLLPSFSHLQTSAWSYWWLPPRPSPCWWGTGRGRWSGRTPWAPTVWWSSYPPPSPTGCWRGRRQPTCSTPPRTVCRPSPPICHTGPSWPGWRWGRWPQHPGSHSTLQMPHQDAISLSGRSFADFFRAEKRSSLPSGKSQWVGIEIEIVVKTPDFVLHLPPGQPSSSPSVTRVRPTVGWTAWICPPTALWWGHSPPVMSAESVCQAQSECVNVEGEQCCTEELQGDDCKVWAESPDRVHFTYCRTWTPRVPGSVKPPPLEARTMWPVQTNMRPPQVNQRMRNIAWGTGLICTCRVLL